MKRTPEFRGQSHFSRRKEERIVGQSPTEWVILGGFFFFFFSFFSLGCHMLSRCADGPVPGCRVPSCISQYVGILSCDVSHGRFWRRNTPVNCKNAWTIGKKKKKIEIEIENKYSIIIPNTANPPNQCIGIPTSELGTFYVGCWMLYSVHTLYTYCTNPYTMIYHTLLGTEYYN